MVIGAIVLLLDSFSEPMLLVYRFIFTDLLFEYGFNLCAANPLTGSGYYALSTAVTALGIARLEPYPFLKFSCDETFR